MRSLKLVAMIIITMFIIMYSTNAYAIVISGEQKVGVGEKVNLELYPNSEEEVVDDEDSLINNEEIDVAKVKWTSNNESVATVDKDGVVTGISKGNVIISAEYETEKANYEMVIIDEENIQTYETTETPVTTIGATTQEENKPGDVYQNHFVCYLILGCVFILLVLTIILCSNLKKKSE